MYVTLSLCQCYVAFKPVVSETDNSWFESYELSPEIVSLSDNVNLETTRKKVNDLHFNKNEPLFASVLILIRHDYVKG